MKSSIAFIVAFFTLVIDQNLKYIARNFYPSSTTTNTGAAFGILQNQNVLLILVGLIVILVILVILFKTRISLTQQYGLGLLLGGASGNVLDRMIFGHVFDFIDLSLWPSFNIADAANVISVFLLLFSEYLAESKVKKHAN